MQSCLKSGRQKCSRGYHSHLQLLRGEVFCQALVLGILSSASYQVYDLHPLRKLPPGFDQDLARYKQKSLSCMIFRLSAQDYICLIQSNEFGASTIII